MEIRISVDKPIDMVEANLLNELLTGYFKGNLSIVFSHVSELSDEDPAIVIYIEQTKRLI